MHNCTLSGESSPTKFSEIVSNLQAQGRERLAKQQRSDRQRLKESRTPKPKMPVSEFRGLQLAKRNQTGAVPIPLSAIRAGLSPKQVAAIADYAAKVTGRKQYGNFCRTHVEEMIGSVAAKDVVKFVKSWGILEKVADASNHAKRGTVYTIANSLRNKDESAHRPLSDRSKLTGIHDGSIGWVCGSSSLGCVSEVGGELFVWVVLPMCWWDRKKHVRDLYETAFCKEAREGADNSAKLLTIEEPDYLAVHDKRAELERKTGERKKRDFEWFCQQRRSIKAIQNQKLEAYVSCHRLISDYASLAREFRPYLRLDGERIEQHDAHAFHPLIAAKLFCRDPDELERFAQWYNADFYASLIRYAKADFGDLIDPTRDQVKKPVLQGLLYKRRIQSDYVGKSTRELLENATDIGEIVYVLLRHYFPQWEARISKVRDHGRKIRNKRDEAGKLISTYYGQRRIAELICEQEFAIIQSVATELRRKGIPVLTVHDAIWIPESRYTKLAKDLLKQKSTELFSGFGVLPRFGVNVYRN